MQAAASCKGRGDEGKRLVGPGWAGWVAKPGLAGWWAVGWVVSGWMSIWLDGWADGGRQVGGGTWNVVCGLWVGRDSSHFIFCGRLEGLVGEWGLLV